MNYEGEMGLKRRDPLTHFCKKCGWKDIGEVELLTHSCSRVDLEFIFHGLLPDLNGKVILDVGSRIGKSNFWFKFSPLDGDDLNVI